MLRAAGRAFSRVVKILVWRNWAVVKLKEMNWCVQCWFNAKVELFETDELGTWFVCVTCGHSFYDRDKPLPAEIQKRIEASEFLKALDFGSLWDNFRYYPYGCNDPQWLLDWEKSSKD